MVGSPSQGQAVPAGCRPAPAIGWPSSVYTPVFNPRWFLEGFSPYSPLSPKPPWLVRLSDVGNPITESVHRTPLYAYPGDRGPVACLTAGRGRLEPWRGGSTGFGLVLPEAAPRRGDSGLSEDTLSLLGVPDPIWRLPGGSQSRTPDWGCCGTIGRKLTLWPDWRRGRSGPEVSIRRVGQGGGGGMLFRLGAIGAPASLGR